MAKRERGGPVMFNLRVRPTDQGIKVTAEKLRDVARHIRENDAAPSGWEVAYIEWTHPGKASKGWKRGGEEDLAFLGRILRRMPLSELRFGEVETKRRGKGGSARGLRAAIKQADRWHRARAKEMRAVERLKSPEARGKHRRLAEKYRKLYVRAQGKAERLADDEGEREYELAVRYKGRKR